MKTKKENSCGFTCLIPILINSDVWKYLQRLVIGIWGKKYIFCSPFLILSHLNLVLQSYKCGEVLCIIVVVSHRIFLSPRPPRPN